MFDRVLTFVWSEWSGVPCAGNDQVGSAVQWDDICSRLHSLWSSSR